MKTLALLVSTAALVAGLGLTPAFALDRMIGGKAVPADQFTAYESQCSDLRNQADATTGSKDASTTDTDLNSNQVGDTDIDGLTIEMCDEGGFTATRMMGDMPIQADQVAIVQARCDDVRGMAAAEQPAGSKDASTTDTEPNSNQVGDMDLEGVTVEMCDQGGFMASAM